MNASAFASDRLTMPGMRPDVYNFVLKRTEDLLRPHFKRVVHPLEGPEKASYECVRIVVAEPVDRTGGTAGDVTWMFLAEVVGAHMWVGTASPWKKGMSVVGTTFSLAVKWPEEFEDDNVVEVNDPSGFLRSGGMKRDDNDNEGDDVLANEFADLSLDAPVLRLPPCQKSVMVDVYFCLTPVQFHWYLFLEAHGGDMWKMLGGIIHPFGLTATHEGLFLRIAAVELEFELQEQSWVLMTDDPETTMKYLGLDPERYRHRFASWDDMMAYAASCRFHDPARHKKPLAKQEWEDLHAKDLWKGAPKTPVFTYWTDEYLPAHRRDRPGKDSLRSRNQVVKDAKRFFGQEFALHFEEREKTLVRQMELDRLWASIRYCLPEEVAEDECFMRGLKREIESPHQDELTGIDSVDKVRKWYRQDKFDKVLDWVKMHWKNVRKRQEASDQDQARHQMMLSLSSSHYGP